MDESFLSFTDKKILDYIRENEGLSKEEIVRGVKGCGSRITILKHIDILEENNLILPRKEKPNSQIYKVYINKDDIKASLYLELSNLINSFSKLLDASMIQFESIEAKFKGLDEDAQWPWIRRWLKVEEELLGPLLQIFILNYNIFGVVKAFEWHNEISDEKTLSDLYFMSQNFLQEIQRKLFDKVKQLYVFRNYNEKDMSFDLLNYNIEPSIETFSRMFHVFQKWELENEFSPIMEMLWKTTAHTFSLDDYSFLGLKETDRTNWKVILSRHPGHAVDPMISYISEIYSERIK